MLRTNSKDSRTHSLRGHSRSPPCTSARTLATHSPPRGVPLCGWGHLLPLSLSSACPQAIVLRWLSLTL